MKKQLCLLFLLFFSMSVFAQTRETRSTGSFTKLAFRVPGKLILKQGSENKVELEGNKDVLAKIETNLEGNRLAIEAEDSWSSWRWGNDDKITAYVTMKDIEGLSVSGSGDLQGQGKISVSKLALSVSGSGSLIIEGDTSGDLDANVSGSGELSYSGKCRTLDSNISGSGSISFSGSVSEKADIDVSGSGKANLTGTARELETEITGSGKILAENMEVETCDVRISGSGDVKINVKKELDADITGSGSVTYKGNPSHVNTNSSGSGKVRKM